MSRSLKTPDVKLSDVIPPPDEAQTSTPAAPAPEPNPNAAEKLSVEHKEVALPEERNLAGRYMTQARCSIGGKMYPPKTEVKLSNEIARHFLKTQSVKPLD